MTVADNTSRNQYTATSGQTVFAYTFEIVDKDDIVVLKNGTTLSEGTDYTVSGVGTDSGGNITLTGGASTSDVLTLYRDMPYSRTQNYTNSGDFLASDVNSDFDNLWLAGEQTNRAFEQSVRKPITDSDSISMELPDASSRANKLLGFDATGAVSTSLVTDDAETIAGIAADIETLAHIQDGTVATDAITNVNTIRTDVTAVSGVASDVTAVAGNTTNINTVATDLTGADDIGTVAGSIANVDTVAGDIANVNSVAGNSTNINTVATDLAGDNDIGTVADNDTYIKTTALSINEVIATAGNAANINTVASNISNVNAVGGVSSDVTTVAGISTEVTAVSSNATNINTVGTNITNVNNVGSNIANVNTVAGLETEINAVVADEADIGVVGANITSVNTVSSNINSVNAVSNNMADVNNAAANATAAAASAADANTSAGAAATSANAASSSASNASSSESAALTSANNASQSAATASLNASAAATSATNASSSAANAATSESNADNSETAAAISASNASSSASTASNNAISAASSATSASNSASQAASSASAAATSATNSETAADTWNSYYSTYLGASATAPSYDLLGQPLQDGALYFNTTDDTMYVFNGSIWIAAESTINIVSVPTQLAADLTTNGNDIIFGDNDKAKFGAGSDLQIFHDGSNSYITDTGTGDLQIKGTQLSLKGANNETFLYAVENGPVRLYHDNSQKLITTSTGIDVTGTVTSDGLTVDGNATISGASNGLRLTETDTTNLNSYITNQAGTLRFRSANDAYNSFKTRLQVDHATGDVSLFEDTGSTAKFVWDASEESLRVPLGLYDNSINSFPSTGYAAIYSTGAGGSAPFNEAGHLVLQARSSGALRDIIFATGNGAAERMRIDSAGRVGLGTTSPNAELEIASSTPDLRLTDTSNGFYGEITVDTNNMHFDVNGTEAMRINSAGRVGIGTSLPATALEVNGDIGIGRTSGGYTFREVVGGGERASMKSNASNELLFSIGGASEAMRIDSAGRVGLGTNSPNQNLDVDGNVHLASGGGSLLVGSSGAAIIDLERPTTNYIRANNNGTANLVLGAGDNLRFCTGQADGDFAQNEAMRITSAGRVGIGTSSPARELSIGDGTGSPNIQLLASTIGNSRIEFGDTDDSDAGEIQYVHSSNYMQFTTNGSEAMRIDSSGNLLVGKTTTGGANVGVEARANGFLLATRDGDIAAYFNRKSSDGSIATFRKDGAAVGTIGTSGGSLDVYSSTTDRVGLRLAQAVIPMFSGAASPNTVDLGTDTRQFKDLYLSGGAYLGGTAAANKLDDYEEGTWTPALGSVTAGPAEGASSTYSGTYVKVGKMVHVSFEANFDDAGTNIAVDDRLELTGLPFAVEAPTFTSVGTGMFYLAVGSGNNAFANLAVTEANESILVYVTHIDGTIDYGRTLRAEFTYEVD